jgi:protease IV
MARPGGAFLRIVLATLLVVILLDLVGLNLVFLGALGAAAGQRVGQSTVVDGNADQTIAVIPVEGLIDEESAQQFDQFLSAVETDKSIKAVVLAIDTPGGSASASDAMSHRLGQFRANTKSAGRAVPVIVAMGGMATSGGYYVACGADYIFAQPATMTANIGVLFPRFNFSDLLAKYGIKETTLVDTGGDYKNLGSMFQPEDEKGRLYLQGLVDGTFEQFKAVVTEGRHGKLTSDTSAVFNGRVYMAADALKLGLIDKIGYAEDAYDYAKSVAGLSSPRIIRYKPAPLLVRILDANSLSNILGGKAQGGINIDLRQIADLIAPRPMYLWRGN